MRLGLLTLVSCTLPLSAQQGLWAEEPQRIVESLFPKDDRFPQVRLNDIARHLGLRAGSRIADVGCGGGEMALVLTRAVGPTGHTYAVDIDEHSVRDTRKLMKKHRMRNVTVVHGIEVDPRLPAGQIDGILMFDVYHELKKYPEMLARIREALTPEGRLVIVDPLPRKTGGREREIQMKNHVMMPDIAEKDLRQAGFEIVHREDRFLDPPDSEWMHWIVVAGRAK